MLFNDRFVFDAGQPGSQLLEHLLALQIAVGELVVEIGEAWLHGCVDSFLLVAREALELVLGGLVDRHHDRLARLLREAGQEHDERGRVVGGETARRFVQLCFITMQSVGDVETMGGPMDLALAVDIGGTKFAVGLVNRAGELLDREIHRIDHRDDADELFDELARLVTSQLQKATERHDGRVVVCGIGSAGPITTNCGRFSLSVPNP